MKWSLSLLLSFGVLASVLAQDGRLEAVRQEVRTPTPDSPQPTTPTKPASTPKSTDPSPFDDDPELSQLLAYAGFYVVTSPFTLPYFLSGDSYQDNKSVFLAYPYAEKWNGVMQKGIDMKKDGETPDTWSRLMTLRASAEDGNNFNGINRLGINFLADSMVRLGVGGSVNFYEEKQKPGSLDQLTIGDINALFRFAQADRIQFRVGVGARFLNDSQGTDWGVNVVYGVELFPHDPLTISAQLETGTLGNAWVFRATSRIGMNWKRAEAYIGYDYLRIGSTELQGPMVGLRFWF